MQPLYQIRGEMLCEHICRLRLCPRVVANPARIYPLLFLSGLHLAFRYFCSARSGDEVLTNVAPVHHLDDGLAEAAGACLTRLLRLSGSRNVRAMVVAAFGVCAPAPKWTALAFAMPELFENPPRAFARWLSGEHGETNRLRLSCAMGAEALWRPAGHGFAQGMLRERFDLDAGELSALKAFVLTPQSALPEL